MTALAFLRIHPTFWELIRHGIWGKIIAICVLGPDMLSFFLTDGRCQFLVNDYGSPAGDPTSFVGPVLLTHGSHSL